MRKAKRKNLLNVLVAFGLLALNVTIATAQSLPSPDSLRAAANKDSVLMQQYRDILRDSDPAVRLSAFVQLSRVDNPIYRRMAYDEAFASGDYTLRALALKYSLFDRTDIIIHYPGTEAPPERFSLRKFDLANGDFVIRDHNDRKGRVQGLSVHIQFSKGCAADFELDDSDVLSGVLNCDKTQYPAQIDLRGN